MNAEREPNLGDVIVAADADALAHLSAHLVRAWLAEAGARAASAATTAKVAVSGGSTPRATFRLLAGLDVPWQSIEWFWVDERAVPAESDRSNYGAAQADLFSRVPAPPAFVHAMHGGDDPGRAAKAYEQTLMTSFGVSGGAPPVFDLVLLGIGDDGHTASLFPGDGTTAVNDAWVIGVPAKQGREARITLTRPVITAARRVAVLAQGGAKREPIRAARAEGSLDERPSRLTREVRGELLWLVDAPAAP